jgi:hypothetical protein
MDHELRKRGTSRGFARELVDSLVRLAAFFGVLAGLAAGAWHVVPRSAPSRASQATAVPAEPPPAWVDVARPYPAFALLMHAFEDSESHYLIRQHPLGGRQDVISFGDPGGPGAHLKIEIYRAGGELEAFADTASEIAARIAHLDPAGPMTAAGTIDTKFGHLALVDVTIAPVSGERRCLGFAHAFAEPLTQIAGTFCRSGPELIDRHVLACALDRLTFTAGAAEPKLAELFAQAETRRTFCGHNGPMLAAVPKPASWLDSPRLPALRGQLAGG